MPFYKLAKNADDFTLGINSYSTNKEAEKKETYKWYFDTNSHTNPRDVPGCRLNYCSTYISPNDSHDFSLPKIHIFEGKDMYQMLEYGFHLLEIEDPNGKDMIRVDYGFIVDKIVVLKIYPVDEIETYDLIMSILNEGEGPNPLILPFAIKTNNLQIIEHLTSNMELDESNLIGIFTLMLNQKLNIGVEIIRVLLTKVINGLEPLTTDAMISYLGENNLLVLVVDCVKWDSSFYMGMVNWVITHSKSYIEALESQTCLDSQCKSEWAKHSIFNIGVKALTEGYLRCLMEVLIEMFDDLSIILCDMTRMCGNEQYLASKRTLMISDLQAFIEEAKIHREIPLDRLLEVAIDFGVYPMVSYLIDNGADFSSNPNIIFIAVATENLDILTYLVNAGLDVNVLTNGEYLTQNDTCEFSEISTLRFLLDHGLDIKSFSDLRIDILGCGVELDFLKELHNAGANVCQTGIISYAIRNKLGAGTH